MMATAAAGWGVYSLTGRKAVDALADTAGNFIYAVPLGVAVVLVLPDTISAYGALLAGGVWRRDLRAWICALVFGAAKNHGRCGGCGAA